MSYFIVIKKNEMFLYRLFWKGVQDMVLSDENNVLNCALEWFFFYKK